MVTEVGLPKPEEIQRLFVGSRLVTCTDSSV